MSTIVVFNQKGGVGKTTTCLNLAAAMHRSGMKTLLLDMDPQAHLTSIHSTAPIDRMRSLFGFYEQFRHLADLTVDWPGVGSFVPSHRELVSVESRYGRGPMVLRRLTTGIETFNRSLPDAHVLVDCCPTVGVLSLGAIFAADLVLIPVSSDYMSLSAARKVDKTLKALEVVLKRRVPRRYLMTRYDRRRSMSANVKLEAEIIFDHEVLKTVIPLDVALATSSSEKQHTFQKNSASNGARAFESLLEELIKNQLLRQSSSND